MGLIPYRNIFDNKGPILFIIEYIGSIANNNLFLFVMEFVAVYIIAFIITLIINSLLVIINCSD